MNKETKEAVLKYLAKIESVMKDYEYVPDNEWDLYEYANGIHGDMWTAIKSIKKEINEN